MPVTMNDLVGTAGLGLRVLASPLPPDAPVQWAHSSDLDDPAPFLEPGQLLLTTGRQFAEYSSAEDFAGYVARLRAVGVVALGFGTEVLRSGTPDELVDAARAQGLGLVEVPYATPFIAVARAVADRLAAEARARLEATIEAQDAVTRAALGRGGIAAAVTRTATLLGAAIRVVDADGGTIESAGTATATETGTGVSANPAEPDVPGVRVAELLRRSRRAHDRGAAAGRWWIIRTLGASGRLLGAVVVDRDREFDEGDQSVLALLSALTEMSLDQDADRRRALRAVLAQFWEMLREGRIDSVRSALRGLDRALPDAPVTVFALRAGEVAPEVRDALERLASRRPGTAPTVFVADEGETVFAVAAEGAAGAVQARLAGVRAGCSRPAPWSGLGEAVAQAERALEGAEPGGLLRFDALIEGNVLGLLSTSAVAELAQARLAPLLHTDDGPERLAEAATWLRHNSSWDPAARELGMHRHTLKARIAELGRALDLDLDAFPARAELWALLEAAALRTGQGVPVSSPTRRPGTTPPTG